MSRLRANQITNENANGAPNFPHGLTVTGIITATNTQTTFSNIVVGSAVTANSNGVDTVGIVTAGTLKDKAGGTFAPNPTTTRGDLIVRGVSVNERLAIGAAGKALKVNSSANGLEYGDAGGFVKLASASIVAQSLSNITLDHFSTTYKSYLFVFSNMTFSQNAYVRMRLKRNDNNSVETGNQYEWHAHHPYNQSSGYGSNNHGSWTTSVWDIGSTNAVHTNWSFSGNMYFYDPMSTIRKTSATWNTHGYEGDRSQHNGWTGFGSYQQMDQIKGFYMFPNGGTISSINYTLFGIIS